MKSSTDFLVSLKPDYAKVLERLDDDADEDGEDDEDEEAASGWGVQERTALVSSSNSGSGQRKLTPAAAVADAPLDVVVSPLKTMVFVDGTWLYYSIHERPTAQCAIKQALGANW